MPPEVHRAQPAAGALDLRNHLSSELSVGISFGAIARPPSARGLARGGVFAFLLL